MFKVEIIQFMSGRRVEGLLLKNADEVLKYIEVPGDSPIFYTVDRVEDRTSLGCFQAWFSNDRALVRLDEHREHYATNPTLVVEQVDDIVFNEDTHTFTWP
ncbi:hypothetical protein DAERI_030254 [Deinococcus aerius]|uniref:Uncharacterized protein n=1 Tax=Deinococcus aerius TaxID=200253 RepID=A0A2I9DG48_9DEIO|nr:hypothetical protein DAERI_030254 [Deinococcus aerius]